MAGMDTAILRDLCAGGRGWSGLLPGEKRDGWSVYRIRFDDGAAYVGVTKLHVIERLYRHLDGEGGDTAALQAGMGYRFSVLASGLTEREARRRELAEIGRLHRPLNVSRRAGATRTLNYPGYGLPPLSASRQPAAKKPRHREP